MKELNNVHSEIVEKEDKIESYSNFVKPSDFPFPNVDSVPYSATNVTAKSGCHQNCKSSFVTG